MRRKDLKSLEIDPRDLPSELNEALEQFVEMMIEKEEDMVEIEIIKERNLEVEAIQEKKEDILIIIEGERKEHKKKVEDL